jgi:uncharacterized RDD family membrane protein YckC
MTQPPDDERPTPEGAPEGTPGEPASTGGPDAASTPPPPAEDQPTIAWTPPPTPPAGPSGPGWAAPPPPPSQPTGPGGPGWTAAPPPPPSAPGPAGSGWSQPTPSSQSGPTWGQAATPPSPPETPAGPGPAAAGPILSASPSQPAVGWAAPEQARAEVAPGLGYASTLSRFVAFLIDSFILAIVGSIIAGLFGAGRFTTDGNSFQNGAILVDPIYTLVAVVIGAAYFILSWSGGRRATLGQRVLSIQVGNAPDGAPLSTEQAVRRWLGLGSILGLLAVVPRLAGGASGLQLLWALVLLVTTATSATKQGLHDRFANSMVVRPVTAGNGIVWACLIVVLILPVIAILAIISLIAVGGQVSSILSEVGTSV